MMRPCAPLQWALLKVSFDASPADVAFGRLADALAPLARYWWRADDAKASVPRHEDYRRLSGIHQAMRGILEVLPVLLDETIPIVPLACSRHPPPPSNKLLSSMPSPVARWHHLLCVPTGLSLALLTTHPGPNS